ncbi:replication initiator protein [Dipodfec virus UOA04_Rod_763]|nr:replication initiator protein [Dipodfec virus UOA04_Rod_763]
MCLFPTPNLNIHSTAYRRGLTHFNCGCCPECLQQAASRVALRCYYESLDHSDNCMVTLTYDNYQRDDRGNLLSTEETPDPNKHVNVRHIQLFLKRLRRYFSYHYGVTDIKYYCGAEYGSRTHRAHYHLLLFGVSFPDLTPYKRSKRGNLIYKSEILSSIWGHGICTVDNIRVTAGTAAYCSKYAAKTRDADDTFSLCSAHLGLKYLLRDFNGYSYVIEGREYPIPRVVWEHVITERYSSKYSFSCKYVNYSPITYADGTFQASAKARAIYRAIRNSDAQYTAYIDYWHTKSQSFDKLRLSPKQRILALPPKFDLYRTRALEYLGSPTFFPPPGSRRFSSTLRQYHTSLKILGLVDALSFSKTVMEIYTCRYAPCHNTASDNLTPYHHIPRRQYCIDLRSTPPPSPPKSLLEYLKLRKNNDKWWIDS